MTIRGCCVSSRRALVAVRSLFPVVVTTMVGCSSSGGAAMSGESSGSADDSTEHSGSADTSTEPDPDSGDETGTVADCQPPALEVVADIPPLPALADANDNTLAAFEVDGDRLIGKFVRDDAAAEQAMLLWQELVLRIPTDQRLDLVQLNIYDDDDPVAWVDGTGVGNQVGRYGFTVAFSADNFDRNPGGPCAPLSGHRGTFDWTLIHELHHIRGRVDGTVDAFTSQFPHTPGDGEGYPEDGTPVLDRDYVTSYAERSSGDEDAAETFTTYVMLAALPDPADALATAKVRWFAEQPDYAAWRSMIRVSEDEGAGDPPPPAPRAIFPFDVDPPAWIYGTWQGTRSDGVAMEYRFAGGSIVAIEGDGSPIRYEDMRDGGALATFTEHVSQDGAYSYTALGAQAGGTESFTRTADGVMTAYLERLGDLGETELQRVDE